MDPVVVTVKPPKAPIHIPRLPGMGPRASKILMALTAVVICGSMVLFAVFSLLVNDKKFATSHTIKSSVPSQVSGTKLSQQASPGGGVATGRGGTSGTNSPVVTLTANPATVNVGSSVTLEWSTTNNPTSCTASEDWSGTKSATGKETTPALSKVQTYYFTLTCKTKTGTGYSTVPVGVTSHVSTGNPVTRPAVTIAASPAGVFKNETSKLTWSVTNNPTSCTASGDWSGSQNASNTDGWTVGPLTTVKKYTFTLTCVNAGGSDSSHADVDVQAPPPDKPITALSSSPASPVTPGARVTLTWTVTNGAATSCTATGDWTGAKAVGGGSETVGPLNTVNKTYTYNIACGNSTDTTTDTAYILVLPANPPTVSLTISPSTILIGNSATISYSSTDSPDTCKASGTWGTGSKLTSAGTHTESTGVINTPGTYTYGLTCTNTKGTGYQLNVPLTVNNPPAPTVSLSINPITTTTGNSATLTWGTTNSPSSCTATGDWSGAKSTSGGTQSTGALNTVKTYSYTLACSNAGGSDSKTVSINVTSGAAPVVAPVITISVNPTSIGTGSSATLNWSTANNPTSCSTSGTWGVQSGFSPSGSQSTGVKSSAGSFTYTLTCSNSAGSDTKSATLTVIAIPVVTVSVSPTSITTGSSATVTWTATNSPSSCTAGGNGWSGSKSTAGGSQSTGAINTAGSYTYTLSCTNTGGTGSSNTATLTVSNPAPVYCGGLTPCYGPTYMASHASVGNCYAWNTGSGSTYPWIINITSFRPNHPGGQKSGSLEETTAVCNHDIHNILTGSASIPGYKDSGGSTTHGHSSGTNNNTGSSGLSSYRVGYYDATSPN